jgi:hypothetical protein
MRGVVGGGIKQRVAVQVRRRGDLRGWWDVAFVGGVVVLSFVLYVGRLGFYSDDWAFLGSLSIYGDHSMVGRPELIDWAQYFRQRPVQVAYQQVLFNVFGLEPFGYHLVNSLLLASMAVFLHLVLRELGVWRPMTVALPIVYALLPHYSTDRFWFAAFGYVLSMALYFLSLYADLRAVQGTRAGLWGWKPLALAALLVSALNYEVAIPLFLLSVVLLHRRYRAGFTDSPESGWLRWRWMWLVATNIVVLAGVVVFKLVTTAGAPETPADPLLHAARVAIGSVAINFGSLGLGLPRVVQWSVHAATPSVIALGGLLGIAVTAYVWVTTARSPEPFPRGATWGRIVAAGVVVFASSYAIFLRTDRILFTSTGINNRVGIAGALGVAMVFIGALGWACHALVRRSRWRGPAFAVGVSALSLVGFLMVNTLGAQWGSAWRDQRTVLMRLREALPSPRPNTAVIVDGICPYVGGATVFESNWDVTGALQVMYGDPTLMGDVASANLTIGQEGLSTVLYGSLEAHYAFGRGLLLFDADRGLVVPLSDAQAAHKLVSATGPSGVKCPPGAAGYGTTILPLDRWYRRLENRYLWP